MATAMGTRTTNAGQPLVREAKVPVRCLPRYLARGLFGLVCVVPISSMAVQWELTREARLGIVRTDNIDLTGTDPESATLFSVEPSLTLEGVGNQSRAVLRLGLEYLYNADRSDGAIAPELLFDLETNPRNGPLTFDGGLQVRDVPAAGAQSEGDAINRLDELNYSYRLMAGSELRLPLGSASLLTASYDISQLTVPEQEQRESTTQSLFGSIGRENVRNDPFVNLNGEYRRTDLVDDNFLEIRSVSLQAGTPVIPEWQISVEVGREWVDQPDLLTDEQEDTLFGVDEEPYFWEASVLWRPNQRTSLTAGYGERFFGRRPFLEIERSTRRQTYRLLWTRGVSRAIGLTGFGDRSNIDDGLDEPNSDDVFIDPDDANGIGRFVIDEQVSLGWRLDGRVSTLNIDGVRSRTERPGDGDQTTWQLRTVFDRRISQRWSWQADHQYTVEEERGDDPGFDENRVGLTLNVEF